MATTPSDQLKYAAAILWQRAEWTTDAIAGSCCNDDHDIELNAITDAACEILAMAEKLGDPRTYSDGRLVQTTCEIETGVYTVHVWHPDPSAEQPRSWRGTLRHDPGEPCLGLYEVSTTPETQEIHVRVVRTA